MFKKKSRERSNWKDHPNALNMIVELAMSPVPEGLEDEEYSLVPMPQKITLNQLSIKLNKNHAVIRKYIFKMVEDGVLVETSYKQEQKAYFLNLKWLVQDIIETYISEKEKAITNQNGKLSGQDKEEMRKYSLLLNDREKSLEYIIYLYLSQINEQKIRDMSYNTFIALFPEFIRKPLIDKHLIFSSDKKTVIDLIQHHTLEPTAKIVDKASKK
jgi:hypothetical protein